jgi:ABC-type transporter Mla maintaining outer membrane lipid asymmetry ATPase subunit MlaF
MTTPAPSTPATEPSRAFALEMMDVTVTSLKDPEQVVLEGVNWCVGASDFWAIGGLHASGKSDFMAVAAGIMPPARGTYRVFGRELVAGFEDERLAARLRLGLVFDGGQLVNHLTIAENIALPIRYHRDCSMTGCAQQVESLLQLTGLTLWADKLPSAMSRNRRQRAGLARALALKPDVLFLDSPLTGLDPRDAAWWLDLLGHLSAGHPIVDGRPLTLAVTADDFRPWKSRAHQFAVIKNKNLVVLGPRLEPVSPDEPLMQELLGISG